jgi:hypothetical protein
MKFQFTIYGSLDPLYGFLHNNISGPHLGARVIETQYKGNLYNGGFKCTPKESSSSAPPRITGEIHSAGNLHTVTVRLRRMFLYHFMLAVIAIVPVSTIALSIAIAVTDMNEGRDFDWAMFYMPIPMMLIASLPFLWMWIAVTCNAKKEMRMFCEQLVRGARA